MHTPEVSRAKGRLKEQEGNNSSPHGSIPPPPEPSTDPDIKKSIPSPSVDSGAVPTLDALDIATLTPLAALSLLSASVKAVISEDSGSPPTPPISSPTTPRSAGFDGQPKNAVPNQDGSFDLPVRTPPYHHQEVPSHHKTPIGSPETQPQPPTGKPPQLSLDDTLSDYDYQCLAMARSFQTKVPPPIPLSAYLVRIHRYCPMSTGVYIAAAHYIQRITHGLWTPPSSSEADTKVYVQITPRSVHRLVLGALRVATKALEDYKWPHSRFAGVGGVPPTSLTRLEIAMCYLLDFKLFVPKDALSDAAEWLLKNGMQLEDRSTAAQKAQSA